MQNPTNGYCSTRVPGVETVLHKAGIVIFSTHCTEIAESLAISEISPAILEKFIMSFNVHISRVDAAGFVMRYLTI